MILSRADPAGGTKTKYQNLNRVEADGVEMELEGKWENGWAGRLSYSFQDTWNSDTGLTLSDSPRHLAKVNLTIPLFRNKIFLGLEERNIFRIPFLPASAIRRIRWIQSSRMAGHSG